MKNYPHSPRRSLFIIGVLFFVFGFITWLNAVLIPYLQIICELSLLESYLVTFSFFISYMLASIPAGHILKRTGYRKGMAIGLTLTAIGALLFIPAGMTRMFGVFLFGLFVQGAGIALLQTAANPYVTLLGAPESAARRIGIMGVCNVVAGMLAPIILGSIALKDVDSIVAGMDAMNNEGRAEVLNHLAERIIIPYTAIVLVLAGLALLIFKSGLPEVDTEEENPGRPDRGQKSSVLGYPHLVLGVLALFLYVGTEVVAGNTIIGYAEYMGYRLETAKYFASFNLLAMLTGYIIGIAIVPRFVSQPGILKLSALSGVIFLSAALVSPGASSVIFITLLGFSNAMIWPSIWPLAIRNLGKHTNIGSALLVMGITGGAILPLIYASFADQFNHKSAYWIILPCYLFILFYAVRGHRIGLVKTNTYENTDSR